MVEGWKAGRLYLSQRNFFQRGDTLEVLEPGKPPVSLTAEEMLDADGGAIDAARHPLMVLSVRGEKAFLPGSFGPGGGCRTKNEPIKSFPKREDC